MDTVPITNPQVALLIPSYKMMPSTALISIVNAMAENRDLLTAVCIEAGTYVGVARNKLAKTAIDRYRTGEITHVWWVDDDMMLPPGALRDLLGRNKRVVSGKYFGRDMSPVVYKIEDNGHILKASSVPDTGLIEINGAGFGCLLMEAKILDLMYEVYGRFLFQTPVQTDHNGQQGFVGEDVFFFELLKEMGIPAFLDCDVECGHIGLFVTNSVVVDMVKKEGLVVQKVEGG